MCVWHGVCFADRRNQSCAGARASRALGMVKDTQLLAAQCVVCPVISRPSESHRTVHPSIATAMSEEVSDEGRHEAPAWEKLKHTHSRFCFRGRRVLEAARTHGQPDTWATFSMWCALPKCCETRTPAGAALLIGWWEPSKSLPLLVRPHVLDKVGSHTQPRHAIVSAGKKELADQTAAHMWPVPKSMAGFAACA